MKKNYTAFALDELFSDQSDGNCKPAFTLAEVLITLGIIGVVAAMTLPTVIGKYRRMVASTKLKKFYSVINQSIERSFAEKGELLLDTSMIIGDENAEFLENWCKENMTKYIVKVKEEGIEKNPNYYRIVFMDGSGAAIYLSESLMYVFYQLKFDKPSITTTNMDGSNEFLFLYNNKTHRVEPVFRGWTISALKNSCYQKGNAQRHGCAALIQKNGWEIPADYPWIR